MRRSLASVPCFLAMLAAGGQASAADTSTTVLGLLSSEQTATFSEQFSGYLRDAVGARPKLGHTGKDQTLEQIAMVFGCLESLDPMCLQDIGSSLETTNLIHGKVDETGGDDPGFKVTVTLFDVTNGKTLKTTTAVVPGDKQGSIYLQEASDRIVAELFGEQPKTTIIVQSNVAGAAILLDDEEVGETSSEPVWLREVEPGEHVVKVEKAKYETFVKEIDIEKGSRMDIDAPLYLEGEKPPVTGGGGGVTPVGGGPKVDKTPKKNKNKLKMGIGAGVGVLGLAMVGVGGGMTGMVSAANDDLAEARTVTLQGQDVCACFDKGLPTADCFGSSDWPSGVNRSQVKDACSSGKTGQTAQFVFYGLGAAAAGVGLYLLIDSILKEKQGPKSSTKAKKAHADEEEDEDIEEDEEDQGEEDEEVEEEGDDDEDEEVEEEDEARIQIVPFFTADGGFLSVVGHF